VSLSGVSSALGLATALQQPTHKEKKDFNKVNEEKEIKKAKKSRSTKALEKTFESWVSALNGKDIEALIALHAPDTLYSTAESGIIKGIGNVGAWYKKTLPIAQGSLTYVQESISVKGNLGAIVVSYTNSADENEKGQALLVFRKAVFGKWLLLYNMKQ